MASTIPDLWPTSALKTDVLTPISILRTQATILGRTTQGLLVSDVMVTTGENGQIVLGLDVIVPALKNYRHRLLQVQYSIDATYPAKVTASGLTVTVTADRLFPIIPTRHIQKKITEKTAYSDSEFVNILQEVLQAPETIALLQSLIVRSNELTSDSLLADNEDISTEQPMEQ